MINEMLKAEGWQSRGWVFIPGYAPIEVGHVQGIKSESPATCVCGDAAEFVTEDDGGIIVESPITYQRARIFCKRCGGQPEGLSA